MKKDMEALIMAARAQGWTVVMTKKGHWQFIPPSGGGIVVASGTPSDWREIANTRSRLRRAGFKG